MPLYEYQCDKCGHRFEVIQKFSDKLVDVCPKCGGAVQKLVSSPAFQFKGSGWYATDYAKKSDGKSEGKTGSSSSESKDTSKGATETSSKDAGTKDSGSKDSGSKDSGSKDSGSSGSGSAPATKA